MRLKIYIVATLISVSAAQATDIHTLLDRLEHRHESKLDMLSVEQSSLAKESLSDKLMPTVNIFGGYEVYSSPNGLLPVAPNELITMVKDQSIGQPFSKQIMREGIKFTWPIFIKSITTLKAKADLLHLASKDKKRLNLYQRQAVIVGAMAQLQYLEALKSALEVKKHSILQTESTTKLKVREGRVPQSALFTLNAHINDLDISMNNIEQNINKLLSKIEALTGISLKKSVPLRLKRDVHRGNIFALKALQKRIEASQKGIKASTEAYYPTVVTKGNYSYSQGDAYNNDDRMSEHFGSAGIYIDVPLFDSSKSTNKQIAKLEYMQNKTKYEQTRDNLSVEAKQIEKEIKLLKKSILLSKKSVAEQEKLLRIAKVSLENEEITQEEYLRYEDALANAKANLYSFHAKKWEDIAKLAVIYGDNLKGVVR
ncbi:outer membrane efflux protein, putative [hydrothermal vent metagenome]|uniref:Outer membrane efflux protein, putative n=1 Tax=hydrothermal vent metagenome TaxID=652676 RepID=A0A1W1C5T3_9ZZZZ